MTDWDTTRHLVRQDHYSEPLRQWCECTDSRHPNDDGCVVKGVYTRTMIKVGGQHVALDMCMECYLDGHMPQASG